jgi:hypothetical protein
MPLQANVRWCSQTQTKVFIEAMQSSLVVLGIGTIHGFCASSEADATLS